ncbi:inositol monophosphatase family protein [Peribacillus tepidiphilus]|uniref:inositol monophosphatase family protein n=1 Tax=Peribacillus tepidiphilus TaxID=2652445 RepID=UPI0012921AA6|nr:inositol monophosphatase family protein [Peribacillus tepidiphilus]
MSNQNWKEIDTYAKKWVKEAGKRLKTSFQEKLTIQVKSNPNDLVTNMDKWTEKYLLENIQAHFPEHKILGEEGSGHELEKLDGIVWIIDPIDGTLNFIHQQRNFAISIGIFEDGVGKIGIIYDVVHDELYHAIKGEGAYLNDHKLPQLKKVSVEESIVGINAAWILKNKVIDPSKLLTLVHDVRGTRSYGSAAIELANVAAGRIDAYITMRLAPWDFAGGAVLVEEVGGEVTDLFGKPLDYLKGGSVFVSKPGLHEEILEKYINH